MIELTEVLPGEGPRGRDDTLLGRGLLRQRELVDLPEIAHVDPRLLVVRNWRRPAQDVVADALCRRVE